MLPPHGYLVESVSVPLDAIQRGSILDWRCPYELDAAEIPPLLDALAKNLSLCQLDLGLSGISWEGPSASGAPLLEALARDHAALAGLHAALGVVIALLSRERGRARREHALMRSSPMQQAGWRSRRSTSSGRRRW